MSDPTPGTVGVYVYGVVPLAPYSAGAHLQAEGIGDRGDRVRLVEYEDLAALVSDSPRQRYELRREYLLGHERVLEEAMQHSDLLPVAFSTVAGRDEDVREQLLKRRCDELHDYLKYVRGRVQLSLKVLWNQERLFAEVVNENEQVRALQYSIAGKSEDAAYYERIELGELTEAAINFKHEVERDALMDALEPLAVESRVNQNFMEMMILNAAFLVERAREAEFDECVQALGERHAGRLIFQYVGPLPPYEFVEVKVRWEE